MYRKNASGWRKHLDFLILDILCMHMAFVLAYLLRHKTLELYASEWYREIMIVMVILNILVATLFSSYKGVLQRGLFAEFTAAVKHIVLVEGLTIFFVFSVQSGSEYSRIVFYVFPVIYLLITMIARQGWKQFLRRNKNLLSVKKVLLVTTKKQAKMIAKEFQGERYDRYQLKGIVIVDAPSESVKIPEIPVLSKKEAVPFVCEDWVDAVIVAVSADMLYPDDLVESFGKMGITVHRVIARNIGGESYQQVEQIGDYMVLTASMKYVSAEEMFVKRVMDILGGLIGCIFAGLVCLIFGPIIYIKSPGPILFTQYRVGEKGKPFKIYKLRTMYPDAEERKVELLAENRVKDGLMFKLEYDPRIIGNKRLPDGTVKKGIGSFLRETSLDEFPQFFNVLKGDMSLVGTRPPTTDEWEKYELHHRVRLAIKPGLTGMWQVSGRSNITDFEEVVKLDTKYISEWSLGLDAKILAKTLLVVFGKKGAL